MRSRTFKQVDVFTARPYFGNPLAVVLDGSEIDDESLQRFTNWTNLSEATFLLPPTVPEADYRVRIFCPGRELPFAGHPTIGSCHAWLEAGGRPKRDDEIVQECGAGLVRLRRVDGRLAFRAPPLKKRGPLAEDDVALIARGLGVSRDDVVAHAWCDNGPNWRGVMLRSAEQVLALRPDAVTLAGLDVGVVGPRGKVGVVAPRGAPAGEPDFEVRAFFPGNNGLAEDPVTGSLNAALGEWLISAGLAPPRYVARQGTALGRDGRVLVERDADGHVWVAGDAVTCIEGHVFV
ncbi:PhzF family phenazine biosynthesis protein [Myxococcota bacterium]|nr:PhzF family phenazine biosynthesis protein [Myxococcota bacterium]